MKDSIKRYAARLTFQVTREASRLLPTPTNFQPGDFAAVQRFCESTYYHFGIVDNPYTEDDLRHDVWDRQAKRIIARVKANRGETDGKRLIQWNGEFQYV